MDVEKLEVYVGFLFYVQLPDYRTKEPTWNEEFTFNIKLPPTKLLQVYMHSF